MKTALFLIVVRLLNDAVVQSEAVAKASSEAVAITFPKADDGRLNAESNNSTTKNINFTVAPAEAAVPSPKSVPSLKSCECVVYYLCNDAANYLELTSGREDRCEHYLEVCCKKRKIVKEAPDASNKPKCGNLNPNGIGFAIARNEDEARFGEFPWMVAIHREGSAEHNSTNTSLNQCGASLIHPQVVLTAAHCVSDEDAKYTIRAGEWDTQTLNELFPHQDREVKTVIIHPQHKAEVLFNDIALLILETPVDISENVDVVCLPHQDMLIQKSRCFASGWGKDLSGKYQAILKRVELPIVSRNNCQDILRKTRLGKHFKLDASFICAGGESGKDTCKGDGGSPLVCPIRGSPKSYFQAGIVSWGIGCGNDQIPGVYANVPKFSGWIDEQLAKHNFDVSYYKY